MVCWQVKLCDPHLSALEVRSSRRGAIQIYVYLYLYLYECIKYTEYACLAYVWILLSSVDAVVNGHVVKRPLNNAAFAPVRICNNVLVTS